MDAQSNPIIEAARARILAPKSTPTPSALPKPTISTGNPIIDSARSRILGLPQTAKPFSYGNSILDSREASDATKRAVKTVLGPILKPAQQVMQEAATLPQEKKLTLNTTPVKPTGSLYTELPNEVPINTGSGIKTTTPAVANERLGPVGAIGETFDQISGTPGRAFSAGTTPDTFSEQAMGATSGLPKSVAGPIGLVAGVIGDPLNALGGGEAKVGAAIEKIAKTRDVGEVLSELKNLGIADNIATRHAPALAEMTEPKIVSDIVTHALKETADLKKAPSLFDTPKPEEAPKPKAEPLRAAEVTHETPVPNTVSAPDIPKDILPEPVKTPVDHIADADKKVEAAPATHIASPEDINLKDVHFHFNTFNPERKIAAYKNGYANTVNDMYAKLAETAKTDAQKEILRAEMKRFKDGLISRTQDMARTESRVANPMVTGPARFNIAKRDKGMSAYMKRIDEMQQYTQNAQRAIERKLKDQRVVEAGGEHAMAIKKLEDARGIHTEMVAANKILKNKKLSEVEKFEQLKALKYIGKMEESKIRDLIKPDYMGRMGFPSYSLTNSNARIKSLEARVAQLGKRETLAETVGKTSAKIGDVEVAKDYEANRLQLKFPGKPSPEMIAKLKSRGFRWSPTNGVWQRQLTNEAERAARAILGEGLPKAAEKLSPIDELFAGLGKTSDAAHIQQIRNSIAEGDLILRTGKLDGRKLSEDELSAVQKSVDNARAKIGVETKTAYADSGEKQTYTVKEVSSDEIFAASDKLKEERAGTTQKGADVADVAKKMGSDQGGISDWLVDKISKEDYRKEKINIAELRKSDLDLDEYLKAGKVRRYKGKSFAAAPIVDSKGEVLDGYNRIAQMVKNGETEIDILRGIENKTELGVNPIPSRSTQATRDTETSNRIFAEQQAKDKTPASASAAHDTYYKDVLKPKLDKGEAVVIGGDDLKDYFGKDYNDANHPIYSKAANSLYEQALKESKSGQVVFTGGGPGSGKTELVVNHLNDEGYKGIIYDSNFSNYDGAKRQIEAARAAGKSVDVYGVIPNLENARGFTVGRELQTGRGITDKTFAHGHTAFPETVRRLLEDGILKEDEVHLLDTRTLEGLDVARAEMKNGGHAKDPLALLKELQYNKEDITKLYGKNNYTTEGAYKGTNAGDIQHPEIRKETDSASEKVPANQGLSDTPKAFAPLPEKPVTEADRLIASGDIRVKYIDGRDVYQVKKGGEWTSVRDEDSAVRQVTKKSLPSEKRVTTPKEAIALPKELQKKIDEAEFMLDFKQEAFDNSAGKKLLKYESRTTGTLPEFTGKQKMRSLTGSGKVVKTSEYGRTGDKIAQEIYGHENNPSTERALEDFEKAKQDKLDIQEDRTNLADLKRQAAQYRKTEAARLRDEKALTKIAQNAAAKDDALRAAAEVPKPTKTVPLASDTLDTGEVRSLERIAREAANSIDPKYLADVEPLKVIVERGGTNVKKKINLYDKFGVTPERVLEKIGFGPEAKLLRTQYDKYLSDLPKEIDKVTSWSKRASSASANKDIFRYLDGEAITLKPQDEKIAEEIKTYLKDWAKRLGLPADKQISHYITHIFDRELVQKEFPDDIAKIISDKIPGSVYDPFLEERLGAKGYKQDTWAALDAYVKRGVRKENMDPILEQIQEKAKADSMKGASLDNTWLEKSQWKYLQKYMDQINMRPADIDTEIDNFIKSTPVGYKFGQRPLTGALRLLRQMTYRGMLGLSPSSALRNLSQGINTYATLGEKYTALGYASLFNRGAFQELHDAGVLNNSFVEDRVLSSTKQLLQKIDKGLFAFFETAEKINRGSAYFGAKAKALAEGKTPEQAVEYAKDIVRKTQFAFGALDTPVGLNSDIAKTLAQFQSFNVKQVEFLKDLLKNKDYMGLLRYTTAGAVFAGTIGQSFGMSVTDLIPFYNALDPNKPFSIAPSLRLPLEVAKAGVDAPDKYGQPRDLSQKAADIGKAALGVVPAGNQLSKTYQGIKAVQEGGVFDKGGKLLYEQDTSLPARAQSIAFGKYSGTNAQAYFNKPTVAQDTSKIQPIYDEIQKLKAVDRTDDALKILNGLSPADRALYKTYKTSVQSAKNLADRKAILPTFQKLRQMKQDGKADEALQEYNALSTEQKTAYQAVKKQVERDQKATSGVTPLFDDGESQTSRSLINTISIYAKALSIDPITAVKKIFSGTGQEMRYAANGAIIIDRMSLADSTAVKEAGGGNNPTMKLDHTLPLQLGGTNDESNLKLVPTDVWASYTPIEDALGSALRGGRIDKATAQSLIKAFKSGELTAEQVKSRIP